MTYGKFAALAAGVILSAGLAAAQEAPSDPDSETVIVWGRGIDLLGQARAASEGIVGYADFETRPIGRAGEFAEVIPGVVATQHSGEGKANQYFLRGFNLDHGTDFSVSVDGVPVNLRTHGHGQGYLDLNFIIPEIVERVEYRKGPYSARNGDFASAGTASYITRDTIDAAFAEVLLGENGYQRAVGAASFAGPAGTSVLFAAEGQVYDGPWVLDQNFEKINAVAKIAAGSDTARHSLQLGVYDSTWTSTDQVPLRAVESGLISRFGFIDGDLGGKTSRLSLLGTSDWRHGDGATTAARLYGINYDFRLLSNFTYFLDDPINGDEFEQVDRRWVYGSAIVHERGARFTNRDVKLHFGGELQFDDITDVGLFRTAGGERLSTVRRDRVEELSVGIHADAEIALTDRLRIAAGLRGDAYDVDVTAISLPVNGGGADDTLVSPSLALAWRVATPVEVYASYGEGFHSNDARGATIAVDPVSGDPADQVDLLARSRGAELGTRVERGGLNATVAAFWLDLESELVFVGDSGATEPNGATRRYGVEASAFWEVTDGLVLDASYAYTDARFRDVSADLERIPGAVESVASAGVSVRRGDWSGNLRVRHFGEAPLIEDGSVTSDPTTLVNLGGAFDFGGFTLKVDVLNVFDADDADITYFYESQLRGEAAPVADRHFHPAEPRQFRIGLRKTF